MLAGLLPTGFSILPTMRSRSGRTRLPLGLSAGLAILALSVSPGATAGRHHHRRSHAARVMEPRATPDRSGMHGSLADDSLYRERGYGYGSTVFDLRSGGGSALGGTCTSVATTPDSCRRGGVYGNGFFYGFGSP